MKLAFSTITCPAYGPVEVAEAARRYGYEGVELYAMNGDKLLPDMLSERLEEVKGAFQGVPIVGINSWGVILNPDKDARRAQVAQVTRGFELAYELNCPVVKTFGGEFPPDRPVEQSLEEAAESLRILSERAKANGVTLVVETHDGFCRGELLGRLLDMVDSPHVGALWDLFHPHRKDEAAVDTDKHIGKRVRHVHVKDAVRAGDGWRFVLFGEGELPIAQAIELLSARGYDGAVALDWEFMWEPSIAGPDLALPSFASGVRSIFDKLSKSR
ncbi:sugar phosphate isomerase/epimerase [Mesorhizobium sp. M0309]|uniref:sugar phosphate isomerase/epimerase family protein n=1 Tax=Mesorhizobium sp. M0309 TaxID=2956933 RepID=UPI00333A395F